MQVSWRKRQIEQPMHAQVPKQEGALGDDGVVITTGRRPVCHSQTVDPSPSGHWILL